MHLTRARFLGNTNESGQQVLERVHKHEFQHELPARVVVTPSSNERVKRVMLLLEASCTDTMQLHTYYNGIGASYLLRDSGSWRCPDDGFFAL
jgi:hypothetical protein